LIVFPAFTPNIYDDMYKTVEQEMQGISMPRLIVKGTRIKINSYSVSPL